MIRTLVVLALIATAVAAPAPSAANTTTNGTAAANGTKAATPKSAANATANTTAKSAAAPVAGAAGAAVPGAEANAAPTGCGGTVTPQTATLESVSGSGCENNDKLVGRTYSCIKTIAINVTNTTGPADCLGPALIDIASGEAGECSPDQIGLLGNGFIAVDDTGAQTVIANWINAKPSSVNGTRDAKGNLVLKQDSSGGGSCELTFTAGPAGKPVKLDADSARDIAFQAQINKETIAQQAAAAGAAGAPAGAGAPSTAKSSAAAAGVSAVMVLMGAAAALVL